MLLLTAQTSTNVAQTMETILGKFGHVRGAEWRHWPENVKLNYLKTLNGTNDIFYGTNRHKRSTNE